MSWEKERSRHVDFQCVRSKSITSLLDTSVDLAREDTQIEESANVSNQINRHQNEIQANNFPSLILSTSNVTLSPPYNNQSAFTPAFTSQNVTITSTVNTASQDSNLTTQPD